MNERIKSIFGDKPVVWVAAWGISKIRKRGGQFAGAINAATRWYDDWYARVMSEETAAYLADLGVNMVILPFSIGGDLRAEKEERDDFERMTAHLHKHGIVSLPYLQYQNILQEAHTFQNTMWGERLDGSRKQFAYWRRTVCQSTPEFLGFMRGLITDAINRGADGIWIDNTHHIPCRCEHCITRFKKWLGENRSDLLSELLLPDFDNIEMPPFVTNTADPIIQALLEFNCADNLYALRNLEGHLRSLKKDALFASNPGVDRGYSLYDRGMDMHPLLKTHDLIYLENRFYPGRVNGQTSGNFHGFISSESAGCVGIPGAWNTRDYDSTLDRQKTGMPETATHIRRIVFEAAATGGSLGLLWPVRTIPDYMCESGEDLQKMYLEHPTIYKGTKEALDFALSLPGLGAFENGANIAVLHQRASLILDPEHAWNAKHVIEELLHVAGIPYNVLYSEDFDAKADSFDMLILPNIRVMSDAEAEQLRRYVAEGGRLLALGECGLFDERRKERPEYALADVLGVNRFPKNESFVFNKFGQGETAAFARGHLSDTRIENIMQRDITHFAPSWIRDKEAILAALLQVLGNRRQIKVKAESEVAATLRRCETGETAIHVLSYAEKHIDQKVEISINPACGAPANPVWHTPEGGKEPARYEDGPDGWRKFTLPLRSDYGVLTFGGRAPLA